MAHRKPTKDAYKQEPVKDLGLEYFDNPKERLEWNKTAKRASKQRVKAIDRETLRAEQRRN